MSYFSMPSDADTMKINFLSIFPEYRSVNSCFSIAAKIFARCWDVLKGLAIYKRVNEKVQVAKGWRDSVLGWATQFSSFCALVPITFRSTLKIPQSRFSHYFSSVNFQMSTNFQMEAWYHCVSKPSSFLWRCCLSMYSEINHKIPTFPKYLSYMKAIENQR